MNNKRDVIVIGSGFGGSVAASRLTDTGLSVMVLERGPWRDTDAVRDMGIGERSSLPYGWRFYNRFLRNVEFGRIGGLTSSSKGLWEIYLNRGVSVACSSSVGGGSHVYTGLNERPRVAGYWDGHHSALSDDALSSHYNRVIEEMGGMPLNGDEILPSKPNNVWRDSVVIDGERGLNAAYHAVPLVDGVSGVDRSEGGLLGSRFGAKHTLDTVYLRGAMDKGLQVKQLTEALGIYKLDGHQRARYRVETYEHANRRKRSYYADRVLLAAGTLNTLRLLLCSREKNKGLSGMPLLGHRFGTNSDLIALWKVNRTDQDFLQGLPCHGEIGLKEPATERDATYLLQVGLVGFQHAKLPPVLVRYLRKNLLLVGFAADRANGTARWIRDRMRIEYHEHKNPSYAVLRNTYAEISNRCGTPLQSVPFNITVHPLGGAVPGQGIELGVLDNHGEVYDHPGLHVVDGAALPGAPGVPPSMSIAAWSSYVSQQIVEQE